MSSPSSTDPKSGAMSKGVWFDSSKTEKGNKLLKESENYISRVESGVYSVNDEDGLSESGGGAKYIWHLGTAVLNEADALTGKQPLAEESEGASQTVTSANRYSVLAEGSKKSET